MPVKPEVKAQDRIIVALDFPTAHEALRLVEELEGLVSFYKIGLELLMSGGLGDLLHRLEGKRVFIDLKLPDDLTDTIRTVVRLAAANHVQFLTLSRSVSPPTIRAALEGRGGGPLPQLLWVPFVSSQDASDFAEMSGRPASEFQGEMLQRSHAVKDLGVDGFIVSGQEIAMLRSEFPEAPLVSPGIRPSGASKDGHKRACTPSEAIRLGADYLVIGRPIRSAAGRAARRDAAQRIIDEIGAG
jgi:orotidine-5'-phosphate decarboxylase